MIEDFNLLSFLIKDGLYNEITSSTGEIAKSLHCSQQTISRRLRELEKKDLIERKTSVLGVKIRIKDQGIKILRKKFIELKNVFENVESKATGTVKKGIGEGAYYIKEYSDKINSALGFIPYQGTLNVRINPNIRRSFLSGKNPIKIPGFENKGRTFGGIECYKMKVNGIPCTAIVPERTRHSEDILELISESNLRKNLELDEDSKVILSYAEE